jgi:hypothetical protein
MSFAVVSAPAELSAFAFACWPGGGLQTTGGGRLYRVISASIRNVDLQFVDPIDGQTLIDMRGFETLDEAKAWIADDISSRIAATRTVQ